MKTVKKFCWVAKKYKKGWKLGLDLGKYGGISYLRFWFFNPLEIEKLLNGSIVFVHSADEESWKSGKTNEIVIAEEEK